MKNSAPADGIFGVPSRCLSCMFGVELSIFSVHFPGSFQAVFSGIGFALAPGARKVTVSACGRVAVKEHFSAAPWHVPEKGASFQSVRGVGVTVTRFPTGTRIVLLHVAV